MRLFVALALGLSALDASAQTARPDANPEISLITFGPGEIYWERFGHNALLVRERSRDAATVYNYGIFDFNQKNFFLNFARGKMMYRVAEEPYSRALLPYAYEGRWAVQQKLALTPGQARELRDFLKWNLRPENVEYHYDYFIANCSTKVRDAIDSVLDGALRSQLEAQPAGTTYRREVTSLTAAESWLMLGMDVALGPAADVPVNVWEDAFVPMKLMNALRGVQIDDGKGGTRPLVAEEVSLLPQRADIESATPPNLRLPFALAGLLFAALVLGLSCVRSRKPARVAFSVLANAYSLITGLAGLVLLAFWLLTDHWPTWHNLNLLLLNPLALILLPTWVRAGFSGWHPSSRAYLLGCLLGLAALLVTVLAATPLAPQQNLQWALLLAPSHVVLGWCLYRRRAQAS